MGDPKSKRLLAIILRVSPPAEMQTHSTINVGLRASEISYRLAVSAKSVHITCHAMHARHLQLK
jgi:hypothetical protein